MVLVNSTRRIAAVTDRNYSAGIIIISILYLINIIVFIKIRAKYIRVCSHGIALIFVLN